MGDLKKGRRGEGKDQGRDPSAPSVKSAACIAVIERNRQKRKNERNPLGHAGVGPKILNKGASRTESRDP